MRRGLTLIELLLSLGIVVVVTASAGRALISAINYDNKLKAGRSAIITRDQFEDRIRDLLHHAWLSSSTTDQDSYFIGGTPTLTANSPTQAISTSTTTSPTSATSGSGGDPNEITFTAAGLPIGQSYLASNLDFETDNQNFGPQGGISEVSISTTAVGSTGQNMQGVFLRIQRPADYDPTQGGNEQLIGPGVTQMTFEFFDGQNWQSSWNTVNQTAKPGVLPAAIKVTYRFSTDSADHIFIVRIPSSPANSNNVVTVTG